MSRGLIKAWSYSRYGDYSKCPAMAKYKHVDRMKEPSNKALENGSRVHKLAEDYVGGRLESLPNELARFRKEFFELKNAGALCEQELTFTDKWARTGWFDRDAWLRIKTDAHYFLTTDLPGGLKRTDIEVIDHKTGRPHPEHADQRSLYALGAFLAYPDVHSCTARHWYLDHGTESANTWHSSQLEGLKKFWLAKTAKMLDDTVFKPEPGNHCRWCFFRKENSGPCVF